MKKSVVMLAALAAMGIAFGAQAQNPEKLAQAKGCLACHSIDHKIVGPAYKDVAAKYRHDKGAFKRLVKKVMTGGKGVWGQVPMPANNVTKKQAETLVRWVLSQK